MILNNNYPKPFYMFFAIMLWMISCGVSHKYVKVQPSPQIVVSSLPVVPVQKVDTPIVKQAPVVELSHQERVKLTDVPTQPQSKDTLVRKLSNAYIDLIYWNHSKLVHKDSAINKLSFKIDLQNEKIETLTAVVRSSKAPPQVIAKATYGMFEIIGTFSLILVVVVVSAHFGIYLIRSRSKPSTA